MISRHTLVAEVLDASPGLANLLLELRVDCIGCSMNKFCTLEDVCSHYDLDVENILRRVQERLTTPDD